MHLLHQSVKVPPSINRNFLKLCELALFWCRRNPDAADRLGMGMLASRFVLEWNHWIAFVLLIFLGGRMIIEGFRGADDEDEEPRRRHGFWLLVTTAIATSLDAMAVGVGLAFLQVNIIATALAIGCATLIMSTLGMMVGRFIGSIIGKKRKFSAGWY